MTSSAEARFNVEVIKLLLQIAWGDDEMHQRERQVILYLGRRSNVPEAELRVIEDCLTSGRPLPAPDMELLRSQPDRVLAFTHALASVDGHVHVWERELIGQVALMLGLRLG